VEETGSFNFEELNVYQKAVTFANLVYSLTTKFPTEERFILIDQFRRAAISISLNIAEGYGTSNREFKRYLKIARGSVRECVALVTLSALRDYIDPAQSQLLRDNCIELSKMLSGFIQAVDSREVVGRR